MAMGMGIGMGIETNVRNGLSPAQPVTGSAQLTGVQHSSSSRAAADADGTNSSDQARLSSAASLAAQAAALPDVRMDKVAAMRDAIANGYSVSSSDVAGAMMNHMLNRSE